MVEPGAPATLADALQAAAARGTGGIRFLRRGGRVVAFDYAELRRRALGVLGGLQARGARAGDAVVLFVDHNPAFIDAFWACQLGGLTAVPLSGAGHPESLRKLSRVMALLDAPVLFSERRLWQRWRASGLGDAARIGERVLLLEDIDSFDAPGTPQARAPADTALIQFSSGSTGAPKGVVLSHAGLLANIEAITTAAAITPQDRTLSWMPLSHDMGLIGFHLVPLYRGLHQTLMDTELFVRRPARWLHAAQAERASLICSPDFGYRHYLNNPGDELPDLSSVRLIFNGAEPVSATTARRFLEALADSGLAPDSLFAVYGLAEAGLAVSFPAPGSGLRSRVVSRRHLAAGDPVRASTPGADDAVELVALGCAVPGCELRIVDAADAALGQGYTGHVQIRGANVTRGYVHDPAADTEPVRADGWLDTGDLGFIHDGQLYITGRARDLLFINSQNYYPQDLETVLHESAGVAAGKVAVCGVADDQAGQQVLVFVQYRSPLAAFVEVAERVRCALAEKAGVSVAQVLPVARLPRTSSGKLQRYRLAAAFVRGEFEETQTQLRALAQAAAGTRQAGGGVERALLDICRRLLPEQSIGPGHNLFELGADSLMLVRLHEEIEASFPGRVEITDLFDYPTIAALANYIGERP